MTSPVLIPPAQTEQQARDYLVSLCWPDANPVCARCARVPVYRLGSGRLRCKSCGYTFQDFTGRRLGEVHLPCLHWLALIGCFAAETAPAEAAKELGISYNTARKAYHAMRLAMAASALDAGQVLALLEAAGEGRASDDRVLGIIENNGFVFVDLLPDIDAQTLLIFKHNFRLRTAASSGVIYTDRYRHYDTLVASAAAAGESGGPHRDKKLYVERGHGFWSYAAPRLKNRRGVGPAGLILYFKELEFRYNHPGGDLPALIAALLCAPLAGNKQE
jgi:transposase